MSSRRIDGIPTVDRARGFGKISHPDHVLQYDQPSAAPVDDEGAWARYAATGRYPPLGEDLTGPVMTVSEARNARRSGMEAANQYGVARELYGNAMIRNGMKMHACQNNSVLHANHLMPFFAAKAVGGIECPTTMRHASTKGAMIDASKHGGPEAAWVSPDVAGAVAEGASWDDALYMHNEGEYSPEQQAYRAAEEAKIRARAAASGTGGMAPRLTAAQAGSARRGQFTRVPTAWGAHDYFHAEPARHQEPAKTEQERFLRESFHRMFSASDEELQEKLGFPDGMLRAPAEVRCRAAEAAGVDPSELGLDSGCRPVRRQHPLQDDVPIVAGGFRPASSIRMKHGAALHSGDDADVYYGKDYGRKYAYPSDSDSKTGSETDSETDSDDDIDDDGKKKTTWSASRRR